MNLQPLKSKKRIKKNQLIIKYEKVDEEKEMKSFQSINVIFNTSIGGKTTFHNFKKYKTLSLIFLLTKDLNHFLVKKCWIGLKFDDRACNSKYLSLFY